MSMCESILTIALVCTVKYLHYCDYYYTLGNDSQSTPKLIAYNERSTTVYIRTYTDFLNIRNTVAKPAALTGTEWNDTFSAPVKMLQKGDNRHWHSIPPVWKFSCQVWTKNSHHLFFDYK